MLRASGRQRVWWLAATLVWLLLTLAIAAYALLKPDTTAADLGFVPAKWVVWLDANYNLRTLVMSLAVLLPPACLLSAPSANIWRRRGLLFAASWLVGLEFVQLWIPTRVFTWSDVGYTLAGVAIAELAAVGCQHLRSGVASSERNS